jgi:UDP-N-acetylmuramoylalanine--D-glutamate ligase
MGLATSNNMLSTAQQKTVIVGLGETGLSCARFLCRQGHDVIVVDSHNEPPALERLRSELPDVTVELGKIDPAVLAQADLLVVSPGVSLHQPAIADAVARGIPVVGDIELFSWYAEAPVAAITGSNGKSTVTTLIYEMARLAGRDVRIGGNIGIPVLDLLKADEPEFYVLELSSFQLETLSSLKPATAVVLNVSQDHMDRYQGMDEYVGVKRRIYQNAQAKVINLDDCFIKDICQPTEGCLRFSLSTPATCFDFGLRQDQGRAWLAKGDELLMPVAELKLVGMHNVANALAALAMGVAIGLPMSAMLEVLRQFGGLPHRCQWIAEDQGINWYNDSKATNVGAAIAAITGMENKVVLIAGGQGKGQDFTLLRAAIAAKGRAVILIGQDAPQIKAALNDVVPVKFAANLGEAVSVAHDLAESGDAVLLSPACASFDMFSGYEDRGEQFVAAVMRAMQ